MRRLLALIAGAVVIAAALPAAGAEVPQQRVLSTYTFRGSGEVLLYVKGTVVAKGAPAVIAIVYTDDDPRTGRPRMPMWSDIYEFGGGDTHGYGSTAGGLTCRAPLQCVSSTDGESLGFSVMLDLEVPERLAFTVSIVTQGASVRIQDRVLERGRATHRRGGYRLVTAEQADADGVARPGQRVEVFRGAAAAGGRRGSVAVALPPCEPGVGSLQLEGGRAPVDISCPTAEVTAFADRATTWRLDGLAAGTTGRGTRLLVIDR